MFNIHFSIERWKWNADFGIYVSNKGHFRTRDKKELPIKIGNGGYCYVRCEGNVNKHRLAHRVVMLTWRPMKDAENLTVDHLDHNKRNNSVDNLEWVTSEENQKRAKEDLIPNEECEGYICPQKNTSAPEAIAEVNEAESFWAATPNTPIHELYLRLDGGAIISAIQMIPFLYSIAPSGYTNLADHKKKTVELMLKRKPKLMGVQVKYLRKK